MRAVFDTSSGLIRLPSVLELFPISKTAWYQGIRDGRYPKPVKLGARTVAWRKSDILALIERASAETQANG